MIPVLYGKGVRMPSNHGLGSIPTWLECKVVESREEYYLEGTLPVGGYNVDQLAIERIIAAAPAPGKKMQLFRIRELSKTMSDKAVHVLACHMSYELVESITKPHLIRTKSGQAALESCIASGHMVPQNNGRFGIYSEIEANDFVQIAPTEPHNTRVSILSVADSFNAEIEWDTYVVIMSNRGRNTDKVIRYGLNLADLGYNISAEGIVTGLYGWWRSSETNAYRDAIYPDPLPVPDGLQYRRIEPVDLSSELEPEEGQLWPADTDMQAALAAHANAINPDFATSITINAVPADLQDVYLYDRVIVIHPGYEILQRAKIVEAVFDPIRERYISLTIGMRQTDIADTILRIYRKQEG